MTYNTEEILNLKEGDKISINNKIFTIQEKLHVPSPHKYAPEITRFELGNNIVLEFQNEEPAFFQIREKKRFFFTTNRSEREKIETIEIPNEKST